MIGVTPEARRLDKIETSTSMEPLKEIINGGGMTGYLEVTRLDAKQPSITVSLKESVDGQKPCIIRNRHVIKRPFDDEIFLCKRFRNFHVICMLHCDTQR